MSPAQRDPDPPEGVAPAPATLPDRDALPLEPYLEAASPRAETDLGCDNCGAPLRWSPEEEALACDHCGETRAVAVRDRVILERPLDAADAAPTGLGRDTRVLECGTCDARVTLEGSVTSTACPFCGSAAVLAQDASRRQLRPESLIPLEVGQERVRENFRAWIRGRWFRPNALKRVARIDATGVYVPMWTFDADAHSDWSAQSGTYYWVTESYSVTVNGQRQRRTRRVRKVRWWPSWGQRDDHHDDVLVLASRGIDERLSQKLGGFQLDALVPYDPGYLAGWRAEEYGVDLLRGWSVAEARIRADQRRRCAGDVPGDTHRALRVDTRLSNVRWKHVLLPMWSVTYAFRGKNYAVLVHGQSGRVVGEAPLSWVKILALILAIGLAVGAFLTLSGAPR